MHTELKLSKDTELYRKGQALLKAAHDYWLEMNKAAGGHAVIYLEGDNGHTIIFTRSEYKDSIMRAVHENDTCEWRTDAVFAEEGPG